MKNQSYFGIDGIEFKGGVQLNNLSPEKLIAPNGLVYGEVEVKNHLAHVKICLPKYIRSNNVIPFRFSDTEYLEEIRNGVLDSLMSVLGDFGMCVLNSIECNVTRKVDGEDMIDKMLNLFHISYPDEVNLLYEGASERCKFLKEKQTLYIKRRNYYLLKFYNKSLQQREIGNRDVENGYLRLEVKMQDRTIKRVFGSPPDIDTLLRAENLEKIMNEYSRIFSNEVINGHVKPCLTEIKEILYKSLCETNTPAETAIQWRDIIVDQAVYRKALKKWYVIRGEKDSSRQAISRLKKYKLPENVIRTIKEFRIVCI